MPSLAPLEIHALARIIDELDYYQLLHIDPSAQSREVKNAYYASSRTFHPDANRDLEPGLQAKCHVISKRITEAYCVLRDPRKRKAYDLKLEGDQGVRIQLAEAKAAHNKSAQSIERTGSTPQGKQFLFKAEEEIRRGDHAAAARNLQMALTFEPGNTYFKELLETTRKQR